MTQSIIREGYLRVTQVLSIFSNLHMVDKEVLEKAAERGTFVHSYLEALEEGFPADHIPEPYVGYISSYIEWAAGKKFIEKPERFYCDELKITGEIDAIYQDGDDRVLVDYKTPERESKTWKIQASAYAYLARSYGYDISRIEFVKLSKTGKEAKVFTYQEDMGMFIKMLECYRYFFKDTDKENILDLI